MKLTLRACVACLVVIFAGCPARSIFPLITSKEHVFDPALVGKWVTGKHDTMTITASSDKYSIKALVGSDRSKVLYHYYEARRGRFGQYWFLDTYQHIREDAQDHLIPSHLFHQYSLSGDTLTLATLDVNWLSRMIDSNQVTLTHLTRDHEVIITASTEELQAFVVRYAGDTVAFAKSGTYVRVQ